MEQRVLILCDPEEDYAQQMAVFLEKDHDFPWEVIVCTGRSELEQFGEKNSVEVLVLAESLTEEGLPKYPVKWLVLLNESGRIRFPEVRNIDKYQEADNIRKELLKLYAEQKTAIYPTLLKNKAAECIAFYSPVRRCLQTSTAIAYSQLLAEKSRVLYLDFECYASFYGIAESETDSDMTSLLYYLDSEEDELALQFKMLRKSIGNWDYIVPMRNSENLTSVERAEWLKLISSCRNRNDYDFIVLDLNDGVQGLFDLLQQCDRIFTIVKGDTIAQEKLQRYEYFLGKKGYESIREKTVKLQLPVFTRLSAVLEDYSRGELADYVRRRLILEERHGICGVEEVFTE